MITMQRPTDDQAQAYLTARRDAPFSYNYRFLGASRDRLPDGFATAHVRTQLGVGRATFAAACQAVRAWKMFPPSLVHLFPERPPIEEGTSVALRIRTFGIWSLAACRIVYIIDPTSRAGDAPVERFGFAYGTLPGHVERGEERFCVEWNHTDDSVWYDLAAFSRADRLLVWLGLPVARYFERRFAVESAQSMLDATSDALGEGPQNDA